jgi:Periplasmic binding protein
LNPPMPLDLFRCRRRALVPWLAALCLVVSASALVSGCESGQWGSSGQQPGASSTAAGTLPPIAALPPPDEAAGDPAAARRYSAEVASALRGAPAVPPAKAGMTRIALLLPLTGPGSDLGQSMLKASQLAFFDIASTDIELLPYDTGGTPWGADKAFRTALAESASLIIGPLLSRSVDSIAPAAIIAGVPVIAFSSDSRVAGRGIYIVGFTPETEVERIVTFAADQGRRKIGILAPNDPYGASVVRAALVAMHLYDPTETDVGAIVGALSASVGGLLAPAKPEADDADGDLDAVSTAPPPSPGPAPGLTIDSLLIAASGERLRQFAATLPSFGIDPSAVTFLGTGAWDTGDLGSEPALIGGWFAAPDPAYREDFERHYRETFGENPQRLATLAYDTTAVAMVLAREPSGARFTEERITDPNGFFGRDGLFRLRPDGTPDRKLAVMEVEAGGSRVIDPAQQAFGGS